MKYKVGDLCLAAIGAEVNVIAHQANCFCAMRSGVAKCIAELFPDAVEADNATFPNRPDLKFGNWSLGIGKNCFGRSILIFNLYGQYNYGTTKQHTDYMQLREAMRGMARRLYLLRNKIKIGLPKLGAGLGGGDWNTIAQIIEEELKAFDVTIYVLNEDEIPK